MKYKFIILAYHPQYVDNRQIDKLIGDIEAKERCNVYCIPHINREVKPIYLVTSEGVKINETEIKQT